MGLENFVKYVPLGKNTSQIYLNMIFLMKHTLFYIKTSVDYICKMFYCDKNPKCILFLFYL